VNMVTNVSVPHLVYYKPNSVNANGYAVIICPGGAFHGLNLEQEGSPMAEWLAENGVAAFILKYRLIPTNGDALMEYKEKNAAGTLISEKDNFGPLALADGVSAINYLQENSSSLRIEKNKIGIIGFSAGGTVAMGTVFQESGTSMPNFVAPIYANLSPFFEMDVPDTSPPLFVCAASNDNFHAPHCIDIYSRWLEKGISAEIHIYSTGGHGFGFRKEGSHLNSWIERLEDWLTTIGWM
jgi:acetyl esterase/lipase